MIIGSYIRPRAARDDGRRVRATAGLRTLSLLLLLPPLFTGCSLVSGGGLQLFYPPTSGPKDGAVTGLADSGAVEIVILPFEDIRADTARVGELEDLSTGRFTRLAAEGSVREWMAEAIRYELVQAGYHAVRAERAPGGGSVTLISGDVDMVQNSGAFKQGAEVAFIVRVVKNGDTALEQRYVGQGSAASGSRMNANLYARSLSLALAEAVKAFVIDVRDVEGN